MSYGTGLHFGKLANGRTTTGVDAADGPAKPGWKSFQATVTGTGAVGTTVTIEVSNNNVNFLVLATITLTGTTTATDGFSTEAPWGYWRSNVTAVSGTGAAVTVDVAQV